MAANNNKTVLNSQSSNSDEEIQEKMHVAHKRTNNSFTKDAVCQTYKDVVSTVLCIRICLIVTKKK